MRVRTRGNLGRRFRAAGAAGFAVLSVAAAAQTSSPDKGALVPEQVRLARVSPTLMGKLRGDAFTYFRFINRQWASEVCEAFAGDLSRMPTVRLHGDAHIEQYAFTAVQQGLDDFDDSAHGPSIIDVVRFLGSLDLATRDRGWIGEVDRVFDRFFEGYRHGLQQPDDVPPPPSVVARLRRESPRTPSEFLDWADSLMKPMAPEQEQVARQAMQALGVRVRRQRPELEPQWFAVKRVGWIHMGIGSALSDKVLLRLEGRTTAPADDVIVEAKALTSLVGVPCLEVRESREVLRITTGADQIGRLRHDVLAIVPDFGGPDAGPQREWWVRSWEPTYREVLLEDLRSADELGELARDAGVQLGGSNLKEYDPASAEATRANELAMLERFEPKIRDVSRAMVGRMLQDWKGFAAATR